MVFELWLKVYHLCKCYTYVSMHPCIHPCIHVSICAFMGTPMYPCIYLCIYISMYASMHLCNYVCICFHVSLYLCIYVSTNLSMHIRYFSNFIRFHGKMPQRQWQNATKTIAKCQKNYSDLIIVSKVLQKSNGKTTESCHASKNQWEFQIPSNDSDSHSETIQKYISQHEPERNQNLCRALHSLSNVNLCRIYAEPFKNKSDNMNQKPIRI